MFVRFPKIAHNELRPNSKSMIQSLLGFRLGLACKQGELRANLAGLTSHTATLAPSVDLNWGSCRHYHQDF